ncbi:hypothetical protein QQF64_003725 [Cirrhinus molitorella]|uniref:Uncharacterized protein n=1 Tax=Cirrhinus molitorella TaxID=172907 RepID=A0ABR3MM45_9TELE
MSSSCHHERIKRNKPNEMWKVLRLPNCANKNTHLNAYPVYNATPFDVSWDHLPGNKSDRIFLQRVKPLSWDRAWVPSFPLKQCTSQSVSMNAD